MEVNDLYDVEVAAENNQNGMTMTFVADSARVKIEITLGNADDRTEQYGVMKNIARDLPDLIDECINRLVIQRKALSTE